MCESRSGRQPSEPRGAWNEVCPPKCAIPQLSPKVTGGGGGVWSISGNGPGASFSSRNPILRCISTHRKMPRPFVIVPLILALALCGARAETVWSGAWFSHTGARHGFTHDLDSTGSVTLTVAPGAAAAPTTLTLDHVPLRDADPTTTAMPYDPATTLTVTVPVADCPPGPQYLIARLPAARLIRWTTLTRGIGAPPGDDVTTASIAVRHRDLVLRKLDAFFDADTSGTWLANDPDADFHWLREDVYYARALFDRGDAESVARANAVLLALCDAQVTNPASLDYGLFFTNTTDRRTPDSSVTFFGAPILAEMLLAPPPGSRLRPLRQSPRRWGAAWTGCAGGSASATA